MGENEIFEIILKIGAVLVVLYHLAQHPKREKE